MNKLGVEERGIGAIIFVGERDGPAWAVRVPVLPGVTETLLNSTNLNYQTKGHHRGKLMRTALQLRGWGRIEAVEGRAQP
jgi:hypothetical protein